MGATDKTDDARHMSLDWLQGWTSALGQAQMMLIEAGAEAVAAAGEAARPLASAMPDPRALIEAQVALWQGGLTLMQGLLPAPDGTAPYDRRFAAPAWAETPLFELMSKSYLLLCDRTMEALDALDGLDPAQHDQLRFAARVTLDALSPANSPFTNPEVIAKTIETGGTNLVEGMKRMLADLERGQLTQVDESAFELGRNIATTPGKVIRETPLYQLIHYAPTTKTVDAVPLLIFPPWINRYYILDLNPANSLIRWAVEQGLSVFVVSWKSADADMAGVTLEDYAIAGQADAIDAVRDALGVETVHVLGYCVAGSTLAATLAWLKARGEMDKVASATFLTTQVDFSEAGDLALFVNDAHLAMIEALSSETGFLDGRYMAATFNLLRGRDLIWSYVVNNYLLAKDYPAFDLLYWNSQTTNLPAKWHLAYLRDFYRDNLLAKPGGLTLAGVPIDLGTVDVPVYVQAGREDHIAPPQSVWKLTRLLGGPVRFLLAGSGHIAGVINPPAAGKYQYWTNEAGAESYEAFVAGATETKGSWWPDWRAWLSGIDARQVPAKGARIPGKCTFPALEDAPGRYARD